MYIINFIVVFEGKADILKRLKAASQVASRILLATDEDREGEAISWHLVESLQPKVPFKRAVFHEITGRFSRKDLCFDQIVFSIVEISICFSITMFNSWYLVK